MTVVFGIYVRQSSCEHAYSALKTGGFGDADISLLFKNDFYGRPAELAIAREEISDVSLRRTAIGGGLGWLVGAAVANVPGLENFFIAGPLVTTFTTIAVGGALGGLVGALLAIGLPENETKTYQRRIADGDIIMSVHCTGSNWVSRAKQLLISTGAEDIASTAESILCLGEDP